MNARSLISIGLVLALAPQAANARGYAGGARGGGGWDFHGDGGSASRTGAYGGSHTASASNGQVSHSSTSANGQYTHSGSSGYNPSSGNVSHTSSGSSPYGSRSSSTSGNVYSGNYSHSGSGSNGYGSYSNSGSGNYYNHTYSGSGTATNAYGQTYHTATYANNGDAYHSAYVTNPVYHGYPAWGWNGGVVWAPAPYYYGGGFWGAFALGAATSAIAYGSIVAANSVTVSSYQVEPSSPGAKLLASYQLTQVPCGPPNLVVIYGPNNSAICANPNNLVAAGNYSVNQQTLAITSEKS